MSSKLFREELERVVTDSLRDSGADGISNLLSDMMSVKQVSLIRCLYWNNVLVKINYLCQLIGQCIMLFSF